LFRSTPGQLLKVAEILSVNSANVVKLDHNQFSHINRQHGVELTVTVEAFGHTHREQIMKALTAQGYDAKEVLTKEVYG
ncbi:MAG: threonine ammonia-lyase, partial [Eubacteriales bacterium]